MLNLIRVLAPKGTLPVQKFLTTQTLRYFCQDISNTFKSRSKLTEFYKFTHPDILSNAPERVKEENLRSIKMLNAYLDAVNNNTGVTEQHLKFYIAEKATNKNKKFYLFEVNLAPLKPDASKELLEKHNNSVVQHLLKSLEETRIKNNPVLKQEAIKKAIKSNSITGDEDEFDLYKVEQMDKKSTFGHELLKRSIQSQSLEEMMDMDTTGNLKKQLKSKIVDQIYEMSGTTFGAAGISKAIEKDSWQQLGNFKSYSLNPKFIYFAEGITEEDSKKVLDHIMMDNKASHEKTAEFQQLRELSNALISADPVIYLLFSKEYSTKEIPGFISVPCDFKTTELIDYITNHTGEAIEERELYLENLKQVDSMCSSLKNITFFYKIQVSKEKLGNNSEIESILLCLKRLQRFFGQGGLSTLFREKFHSYSLNIGNEFNYQRNSLHIPSDYKDRALFEFLKNLLK